MASFSLGATPSHNHPGLASLCPGCPLPGRFVVISPRRPKRPSSQLLRAFDPATSNNVENLRVLPLAAGLSGLSFVLLNRFVSGVAPVADASSAQSRADVLVIAMAAALLLTGLTWISLKPRDPVKVKLNADQTFHMATSLPSALSSELEWSWDALRKCTRCSSLAVLSRDQCLVLAGAVLPVTEPWRYAKMGSIGTRALSEGRGNYLANLALYPGRKEFTSYLPENTQAVVVQPVGDTSLLIAASDTQRGFNKVDQAWMALATSSLSSKSSCLLI
ncbi:hypothetical protein WJX74_004736 [Apatococcus lobatus]|uniref:Cofactor assembly of complex C subunit B, CCB2/CCB4 n=1 Tax=Apatococcus lobatus TaxID=904363 RepID=A0AAW1Q7F0_9CHLO